MDALESLLRPIARLVNRRIRLTTPARELCGQLQGKVIAVRVRDTALAMYVRVDGGELALLGSYEAEPDAAITGSLLSLARLAGQQGEAAVRDGSLELAGDAEVARDFQRLLHYGRPDIEEELSGLVGDVAAHEIGELARRLGRWGEQARETIRQNLSEYLQEESRALPTRYEVEEFRERVESLRDDAARLDARLERLESLAGAGD